MKRTFLSLFVIITVVVSFWGKIFAANAMVPTLSLSASGNGDMVSVTIYGDAYANAILYYQKAGYGMQSQYLGTTNANGYFSTTVSTSGDGISTGSYVYVVVNNQQSSQTLWPYNYNNGYNNYGSQLSLSQTSISLNAGASANVTVYGSGSYYISSNTNSNIASANISGNSISIYGVTYGSDTVSICQSGGQCASLYVTVNYNGTNYNNYGYNYNYGNNYSYNSPTLSQSNISATIGQPTYITISGGTQPYTMYPSSPNIFNSVIGGNTLTISGLNNGSGTLSVCSSSGSSSGCATLYVTVGYQNYNYGYNTNYNSCYSAYCNQLSLSQTSISLNVGSTTNISVNGGSGSYYISSNTNSNIASANISGNSVSVYGIAYGSDTISICQSGGQCASLYVTVNYNGTNYNNYGYQTAITFSQNNPTLSIGQSLSLSIYGGTSGSYYVAYNSNSNGVQTNISGSTLNVTGETNSIDAITVCSVSTNCSAVTVNVGYYNTPIVY